MNVPAKSALSLMLAILSCLVCTAPFAAATPDTKSRVLILTTGGTIAGQADPRSALGYNAGQIGAKELIASVPGIDALAALTSEKVASVGSQNMSDDVLLALARRIGEAFTRNEADGIVITHGTDTMEETAFFLDLVLPHERPVVMVGAMRPSDAPSADGPANLFNAVRVAISPAARGRGVLITLNDTIHGARAVQKMNTSSLETFQAPNFGPAGRVNAAGVGFFAPATPSSQPRYRIPPSPLPRVDIVYAYGQADDFAVSAAVSRGARGIVLAGVGDGNAPDGLIDALKQAVAKGIVVVRSTRVGSGMVERNIGYDDDKLGFVASLDLNPQKARILTRLLIANGITSPAEVQRAFALD